MMKWLFVAFALLLASPASAQSTVCASPGGKAYVQTAGCAQVGSGGGGEATVLIDATSPTTLTQSSAGLTTTTFTVATPINVGSGVNGTSNLVLICGLHFIGAAAGTSSAPSLNWDTTGTNQAMTKLTLAGSVDHIGNGNAGDIYLFGLVNPTLGAKKFSASWTGANEVQLSCASFVNADQTGGSTTFGVPATNTGTGASANVTVSASPTTRKFFGAFVSAGNFATASGTNIGDNNSGNLGGGAANWDAGTATSLSYSTASAVWAAVGATIKGH